MADVYARSVTPPGCKRGFSRRLIRLWRITDCALASGNGRAILARLISLSLRGALRLVPFILSLSKDASLRTGSATRQSPSRPVNNHAAIRLSRPLHKHVPSPFALQQQTPPAQHLLICRAGEDILRVPRGKFCPHTPEFAPRYLNSLCVLIVAFTFKRHNILISMKKSCYFSQIFLKYLRNFFRFLPIII